MKKKLESVFKDVPYVLMDKLMKYRSKPSKFRVKWMYRKAKPEYKGMKAISLAREHGMAADLYVEDTNKDEQIKITWEAGRRIGLARGKENADEALALKDQDIQGLNEQLEERKLAYTKEAERFNESTVEHQAVGEKLKADIAVQAKKVEEINKVATDQIQALQIKCQELGACIKLLSRQL